jgi:hypothetical protein
VALFNLDIGKVEVVHLSPWALCSFERSSGS